MSVPETTKQVGVLSAAVVLAALGYFVDIFDLVLFSVLRVSSLKSLGVPDADLIGTGGLLLDLQLGGMLLGGFAWGVLADKRGRLTVLFGSILLYSAANLANAFVHDLTLYGVCRFLAGIGLAGELGAGITLVSELLPTSKRGLGTTVIVVVGATGALAAATLGESLTAWSATDGWRYAYGIGGVVGLALLALRLGVLESSVFNRAREHKSASFGDLRQLLWPPERGLRFLRVVLVGMPVWFTAGVVIVFSPEIGGALGLDPKPTGAKSVFWSYLGVALGDIISGVLSNTLKSRKRVLAVFLVSLASALGILLIFGGRSHTTYYALMTLLGTATGYWVIFATTAAEQFGTNLRGTVATTAPNVVRGTAIPITAIWMLMKPQLGTIPATMVLGVVCISIALLALWRMDESFSTELDYLEK
ncbi:MAG: MFS transporter [Archangium sp.]|nr:MFS transporter [Archangium sp.]